jgi:4-alpha-glucanotransferase
MPEDREHLLVYTGTHDNDPFFSWYRGFKPAVQRQMRHCLKRMGYDSGSFVHDVIRYSLHSAADMVIIPMADWLHKGHEARLNTPGTVGAPNWMWRMSESGEFASVCGDIRRDLEEAGRIEE